MKLHTRLPDYLETLFSNLTEYISFVKTGTRLKKDQKIADIQKN